MLHAFLIPHSLILSLKIQIMDFLFTHFYSASCPFNPWHFYIGGTRVRLIFIHQPPVSIILISFLLAPIATKQTTAQGQKKTSALWLILWKCVLLKASAISYRSVSYEKVIMNGDAIWALTRGSMLCWLGQTQQIARAGLRPADALFSGWVELSGHAANTTHV